MADQSVAATVSLGLTDNFAGWMLSEQRRVFLLCQRMLGEAV